MLCDTSGTHQYPDNLLEKQTPSNISGKKTHLCLDLTERVKESRVIGSCVCVAKYSLSCGDSGRLIFHEYATL